jgi:hypothetical protein
MGKRKPKTGLVPQPRGGAIYQGPAANPVAGPGRPPSQVKAAARESFAVRIPVLEKIADSAKAKHTDRIRAVEVLGRMGLMGNISTEDVKQALKETSATIRGCEFLLPEQQDELLQRIAPHWRKL